MITVKVFNAEKLINKIDSIKNVNLEKALTKAALIVENEAKLNCPVGDTGLLRSSITHEVEGDSAYIGTNIEYAPYVEIGTGIFSSMGNGRQDRWCYKDVKGEWHSTIGQHPQPFLEPALTDNVGVIENTIQEEVKKELEKIAGR